MELRITPPRVGKLISIKALSSVQNGIVTATKNFSILEFLAELQQHLPKTWEQTSRHLGIYSCRFRGEEKKASCPITTKHLPDSGPAPSKHWAACLARVFEVDPLICAKCGSPLKIKTFITDPREAARISRHLGATVGPGPPLPCQVPVAA